MGNNGSIITHYWPPQLGDGSHVSLPLLCKQTDHGLTFRDGQLQRLHGATITNWLTLQVAPSINCCSHFFLITAKFRAKGCTVDLYAWSRSSTVSCLQKGTLQVGKLTLKRILFSGCQCSLLSCMQKWMYQAISNIERNAILIKERCNIERNAILIKERCYCCIHLLEPDLYTITEDSTDCLVGDFGSSSHVVTFFFSSHSILHMFSLHWMHYTSHHHFCWSQFMDEFLLCVGPRQDSLRYVLLLWKCCILSQTYAQHFWLYLSSYQHGV